MDKELSNLLSKLNNCISQDDFIDIAYEVIEEIEERDDADEAITPILELMERNPNVDFGMPGPLVHFVEKYYKKGYEEKLVDSLRRLPTKHTLWMLNRIINGLEGNNKEFFISILDEVFHYSNVDVEVADLAKHYKSLHV
jgi:hypothetical protein